MRPFILKGFPAPFEETPWPNGEDVYSFSMKKTNEGFWIFGYGSLMWRTGFPYLEAAPARLHGYHRCLCIYSINYRGTPDCPGLVMGLDRGGSCKGQAFKVAAEDKARVLDYLQGREMVHGVYVPRTAVIKLENGRRIPACVFITKRDHRQYAGKLGLERTAKLVRQGTGCRGSALEYLENTLEHMEAMGIKDAGLRQVLARASQPHLE